MEDSVRAPYRISLVIWVEYLHPQVIRKMDYIRFSKKLKEKNADADI